MLTGPSRTISTRILVGSVCAIVFWGSGLTFGLLPIVLSPIQRNFSWNGERIAFLMFSFLAAKAAGSLVAGWLIDRFDVRLIIAMGALLSGLGSLISAATASSFCLALGFAMTGFGYAASTYLPAFWIASEWLPSRVGLYSGLFIAAGSAGAAIMPPVLSYIIEIFGWRFALAVGGALIIAISVPLALKFIPRSSEQKASRQQVAGRSAPGAGRPFALMRSYAFVAVNVTQILFALGYNGLAIFMVAYLIQKGYLATNAAVVFSAVYIVSMVGCVALGWIADKLNVVAVMVVNVVLNGVSIFLLGSVDGSLSNPFLILFVLIFGFTQMATTQLIPVVIAKYVDKEFFGTANGICGLSRSVAMAVGPLVIGIVYDRTGNYIDAFYVGALLILVSAAVAATIGWWSRAVSELSDGRGATSEIGSA